MKKNKKSRKSSEVKESLYIALGTSKGRVSLYSYAEAKVSSVVGIKINKNLFYNVSYLSCRLNVILREKVIMVESLLLYEIQKDVSLLVVMIAKLLSGL